MKVLALDLQPTRLGYAVLQADPGGDPRCLDAGVYRLGLDRDPLAHWKTIEAPALRAFDLRRRLRGLLELHAPDVLAFEKVMHHAGTTAAHGWGAQEQAVEEVAHLYRRDGHHLDLRPVNVMHGKVALANSGRAEKADMACAAEARWPGWDWRAEDCDAADAAGVGIAVICPPRRLKRNRKRDRKAA